MRTKKNYNRYIPVWSGVIVRWECIITVQLVDHTHSQECGRLRSCHAASEGKCGKTGLSSDNSSGEVGSSSNVVIKATSITDYLKTARSSGKRITIDTVGHPKH